MPRRKGGDPQVASFRHEPWRSGSRMSKYSTVDDRLYAYLLAHEPPDHEELQALRAVTRAMPEGYMQVTPEQGHLLAMLVRLMGATHVLEIGTFTGSSTLAMALALPAGGRLTACDLSKEWTDIGRRYWQRAGVADKIDLRIGPAVDALTRLETEAGPDQFDLTFIDADKTGYDAYYEAALRLVRPGGLIVLDNMLRRGRVADPSENDADTRALRELNTKIAADERVDRVLLPIAGGMTLARRRYTTLMLCVRLTVLGVKRQEQVAENRLLAAFGKALYMSPRFAAPFV